MIVREGFISADPYSGSLIDRARMAPTDTLWRRLLIWGVTLALASVAAKYLIGQAPASPGLFVLTAISVLVGCAGLGASVHCFARFALSKELRYLWAADGFCALAGGAILQVIADVRTGGLPSQEALVTSSWLVAGLFFSAAAHANTTWREGGRKDTFVMIGVSAVMAGAYPLAGLPYALDPNLLRAVSTTSGGVLGTYLIDACARLVAPVLITVSLFGVFRRAQAENDRAAGLMSYFLTAAIIALVARAASALRFDEWWAVSQIVFAFSWLTLVVGIGVENAVTHNESRDRLEELETLHHVSWSLVGAGSTRDLLDLLVRAMVEKFGAQIAAVYLADELGEHLELAAAYGSPAVEAPIGARYPLVPEGRRPGFHTGHTARAFTSNEIQIAQDVFVDVEFVPWRQIAVDDGCAASVPLVEHGRAIGVMNLYFPRFRHVNRQRLKLLCTTATAATPAIQYALSREEQIADGDGQLRLAA